MATYNGEKYLIDQVDSIMNQLGEFDELVVSDDGSTDNTIAILESYDDPRIKILHHEKTLQKYKFGYTTANFENAINNASGDCIFLADQDDVWCDNKVHEMKKKLQYFDVVMSDCSYVDAHLNIIVPSKFKLENVNIGLFRNIYKCGYLGCCMAFNRRVLEHVLPFPKNTAHDLWIGLVGAYLRRIQLLPIVTTLYRRHDCNVSSTNNKIFEYQFRSNDVQITRNTNSFFYKIGYRVEFFIHFIVFLIGHQLKKFQMKNIINIDS
jgi:glycosyltransferase involved in cell wall biosynthesis